MNHLLSEAKTYSFENGGDDRGGSLISPDGVAPSRTVGVSASAIFLCTIKVQKKIFLLLAPAHLGGPGKRAVKCVCVCVTPSRVPFTALVVSWVQRLTE